MRPETIAVRRATPSDAGALVPLLGELGYPAEPAAVAARLEALLGSPRDAVLVAEDRGGAVLGVLALHWGTMLHQPAPVARIGSLVVAEAARGRGVGSLLVREAAALARAEGCAVLELTTGKQRDAAHAFYAAQGFAWTALRFGRALATDDEGAAR
jgi:ribosomal protein S18 acetylase RimI-like enzyme